MQDKISNDEHKRNQDSVTIKFLQRRINELKLQLEENQGKYFLYFENANVANGFNKLLAEFGVEGTIATLEPNVINLTIEKILLVPTLKKMRVVNYYDGKNTTIPIPYDICKLSPYLLDLQTQEDELKKYLKCNLELNYIEYPTAKFKTQKEARAFSRFLTEINIKHEDGSPKLPKELWDGNYGLDLTDSDREKLSTIGKVTQVIGTQKTKPEKQDMLYQIITNNEFSVDEFNRLFVALKYVDGLNTHENPDLDRQYGIKNTSSWQYTMGLFRERALKSLFKDVEQIEDPRKKIELLSYAKKLPLFSEHRSNSFFSAWGRTSSFKKIEAFEEQLIQNASLPLKK